MSNDSQLAHLIAYYEKTLGRMLGRTDSMTLVEMVGVYPNGWVERAMDEAARAKVQAPMRYIEKCLENWWKAGGITESGQAAPARMGGGEDDYEDG